MAAQESSPKQWHRWPTSDVLARLDSTLHQGLSQQEAHNRRDEVGRNVIAEGQAKTPLKIFLSQFSDLLVLILIGAGIIAGIAGEPQDVVAIFVIVFLNACLGFFQEWRAEKAISALKGLAAPHARVRRGGQVISVPAFELVPGDIVLLEAGNLVPADLRLLESADFAVDESMLTGESLPVTKSVEARPSEGGAVVEQTNMAFKGTLATSGRAVGVVTETGMRTELGKIARLLHEEVEVKTPLQARLARFAKYLAGTVLLLCGVIFAAGLARGEKPILMFMTALSLAVAAVPESLPAVVTIALAIGARNMGRLKALVRKLPAVEALGSVTTICTDKTGTLTENKMRAEKLHVAGRDLARETSWIDDPRSLMKEGPRAALSPQALLMQILAQSNDAFVDERGQVTGEPTEAALLRSAKDAGVDKAELERAFPRVAEFPFSSDRGMMSTIHSIGGEETVFVKGAPEVIIGRCNSALGVEFDQARLRETAAKMASGGLRVLAVAFKTLPPEAGRGLSVQAAETELSFVGFVGLMDPPREEVFEAIHLCQSAGIRIVMITGDHPGTAKAIALRLGLTTGDGDGALTGTELAEMNDEELAIKIKDVAVFARVAPEQKIRIVKALQSLGEVVAMTGDGVNDAPALKRADIGVSMGQGGTDVAREASHMILLDDNFATIVNAVREGRRIYDNIRKFVRFVLSGNSGEIWPLFLAPFLGLPTPLLPIQILWINFVTDGLPGLALTFEPEERDLMKRRPRDPKENVLAQGLWQHALWVGLLTGALTLSVQAWALHTGHQAWQTMAFTVLTMAQMGHVLAIRSDHASLFSIGVFSNPMVIGSVAVTFLLHLGTLYIPAWNRFLGTEPLTVGELMICLVLSTAVFIAVEVEKYFRRHRREPGTPGPASAKS